MLLKICVYISDRLKVKVVLTAREYMENLSEHGKKIRQKEYAIVNFFP